MPSIEIRSKKAFVADETTSRHFRPRNRPQEALARLQTKAGGGFEIEMAAPNHSSFDFSRDLTGGDADGKLWVCRNARLSEGMDGKMEAWQRRLKFSRDTNV